MDHVLEGRRVEHHVDPLHQPGELARVAHVPQEEVGVGAAVEALLQEEELALVVVAGHQLAPDGAAAAPHQWK